MFFSEAKFNWDIKNINKEHHQDEAIPKNLKRAVGTYDNKILHNKFSKCFVSLKCIRARVEESICFVLC